MSRLKVLIVGCGNIAGRFDASRLDYRGSPLTHAGAYSADGRYELAACVDPDDGRRESFMQDWKVPIGLRSLEELRPGAGIDVVSICSPTSAHATDFKSALRLRPRLLFCEKPVAEKAAQTEELVAACHEANIPLAVNYTRRWDSSVVDFREGIRTQRWGALRSVVGYYNKGLLNNGSHMLDLLGWLLGSLKVVHSGPEIADHTPLDPSIPAWLESANGIPVALVCGHSKDFALFEIQFVFARALIGMEEGGLYWREREVADSTTFAGYRVPGEGVRRAGGYRGAMLRSVGNLFDAATRVSPLASDGNSALVTQRLCEEIGKR